MINMKGKGIFLKPIRGTDIGAGRPLKLKVKERFLMLLVGYTLHSQFLDFCLTLIKEMFVEIYLC